MTLASGCTQVSTYDYVPFDRSEVETDRFGQQVTHGYDAKSLPRT
ncbi:MAG: hypothetical protein U5L08_12110 [Xanthomonadales bacterium]|nr:hypothetical protein [Xanthomonadales bacterium]